jgi:hypothetical protein
MNSRSARVELVVALGAIAAVVLFVVPVAAAEPSGKRIAITLDDLPGVTSSPDLKTMVHAMGGGEEATRTHRRTPVAEGRQRTRRRASQEAHCPETSCHTRRRGSGPVISTLTSRR